MPIVATGTIEIEVNLVPPPAQRRAIIRGKRAGDSPVILEDPAPEVWQVLVASVGRTCSVTYDPGPPIVLVGLKVT